MKPALVYHAVGPVHLRNAQLVQSLLPEFELRLAYETGPWWMKAKTLDAIDLPRFALRRREIPADLWAGDVRGVVFSALQPRPTPLQLLAEARQRRIPTAAIEESNQLALNDGRINNYLLPVDQLLVASRYEAKALRDLGVPPDDVRVTGWPFGRPPNEAGPTKADSKKKFGLDPSRRVALLTLTALHDAGETPRIRRRQLELAARLPRDHQLAVKPHPIERPEGVQASVAPIVPDAVILPGDAALQDVLAATDVVLNRGASQVAIEALQQRIPVVILDTGVKTPFHASAPHCVVSSSQELSQKLKEIAASPDPVEGFQAFLREHAEHDPAQARSNVAQALRGLRISAARSRTADLELALVEAWRGRSSLSNKRAQVLGGHLTESMRALGAGRASRRDLELVQTQATAPHLRPLLQSLWVRNLLADLESLSEEDLAWMRDFPPHTNGHWFAREANAWLHVLLRRRRLPDAASFVARLKSEFPNDEGLQAVAENHERFHRGPAGRLGYYAGRWRAAMRRVVANGLGQT